MHVHARVCVCLFLYTEQFSCALLGLMNNFCTVLCCGTSGAARLHHTAPAPHLHSTHTHARTRTHTFTPTAPPIPTSCNITLSAASPCGGMQQAAKLFLKQQQFPISQCHLTSSPRVTSGEGKQNVHGESNKRDLNSQTKQKKKAKPKSTTPAKLVSRNPDCGWVTFKFKPPHKKKRRNCAEMSAFFFFFWSGRHVVTSVCCG